MSGRIAILCSGQGGQHRDMFACTGAAPAADTVFAQAAALLGEDPRHFVATCGEDALFANRAGQILCCTQALAAWAMLGDDAPRDAVVAGYSAGELAAWGVAGAIAADAVLPLAAARAEAMDRAAPPDAGLAAISGLDEARLAPILRATGTRIAIRNAADQFVVGGTRPALADCLEQAARAGARQATMLRVAVPSHTRAMQAATDAFARALEGTSLARPPGGMRLLTSIDAETMRDPVEGAARLARQISHPIAWGDCLAACAEAGATTFLELGPGGGLARMAENALGARARPLDAFRSRDGVRDWLAQG